MPRIPLFAAGSYTLYSPNMEAQRTVNMFFERDESGAGEDGEPGYLRSIPGLKPYLQLPVAPIRGMYVANDGQLFVCAFNKLYRLLPPSTWQEVGTLLSTSGTVSMADNSVDLILVDGTPNGYKCALASPSLVQITDPDFYGGDFVVVIDGYFILNKPDTQIFYISELNSTDFNGLDFAQAEARGDNIIAVIANHRELWLFGTLSVEVWFDSGNPSFPFERIQGSFFEHGCAAPFSIVRIGSVILWLSRDDYGTGMVWLAEGYQPNRISDHGVETAIGSYDRIDDAIGYSYQMGGHRFYVLNFPSANATWCFDLDTQQWFEMGALNTTTGGLNRYDGQSHVMYNNKHVVADWATNDLYTLDFDHYVNGVDRVFPRIRASPHIGYQRKRIRHNELQVILESGVGLDGSPPIGKDPQIMLRWSDDGGHTWSSEHWTSAGKIGQYQWRANWHRLGRSRDRIYEIQMTDPVKWVVLGALLDIAPGLN